MLNPSTTPINQPLVSVVMATYYGERFIGAQLESILAQTYSHLEVIIVDDGSMDRSYNILEEYAAKDQRIRLFKNEKNIGYIKNFERGLLLATGDFIAPSDQDDIWLPEKIEVLINGIGDATIAYCDSSLMDENGIPIGKKLSEIKRLVDFNDCLNFLVGNSAAGHAMLIKKELIRNSIPLAPMIPHDHWLGFVATLYQGIKFIDQPLVQYRQHNSSVFGAVKVKDSSGERRAKKRKDLDAIRQRVKLMHDKCKVLAHREADFFMRCSKAYESFSLIHNFNRMFLFFSHNKRILAYKRRNLLRRWLYCIKIFFTIQ